MEYRKRLNPERSLRTPKGIKGTRQRVIVTHNPSEIDQAQLLLVTFPNLSSDDVIVPRMVIPAPLSIGIITSRHYLSEHNKNGGTSETGDRGDEKTAE